jgi:hypothetical protein
MISNIPVGMIRFCSGIFLLLLVACRQDHAAKTGPMQFSLLDESETNIDFNNRLEENDSTNFLVNQYIYIGSGVGIGDFNRDGLQDIFFAGAQADSKLYINKGNFRFEDITKTAGILPHKWSTGVSVVDINNDGWQDIYVCVTNSANPEQRRNLLYINKGNLKFSEEAKAYGLDDPGYSTQAAFLDFDLDGDLDMYLMNHNVFHDEPNNFIQDTKGNRLATDKLFRNDGIMPGTDHPAFTDVSSEAGIGDVGYGLGIVVSDLNKDGWPDIYVANDFISNDLLWLNNQHGGFKNVIAKSIHHQSYNSMGVDASDLNNDLLPDIAVLDMLPETNYRKKIMFAGANPERYEMEQQIGGYQPQFARNMLQVHNGLKTWDTLTVPFFSEIGNFAGLAETDWSWSILMADLDNDGLKDIHITNGLAKDLTNNDFLFFRHGSEFATTMGNGMASKNDSARLRKELDQYGSVKINNYLFKNSGNFQFSNVTDASGLAVPSISHGAVTADLDNDGDLDLVTNNMNQPAFVWRNETRQSASDSSHNYLTVQLSGDSLNKDAFGARLTVYAGATTQFLEQQPVRGYLSSVDNRLHFGLGNQTRVDSLQIVWPDNQVQVIYNINSNQILQVKKAGLGKYEPWKVSADLLRVDPSVFEKGFKHNENAYFDFGKQRLIPQKFSQLGPPLAVSDINKDGLQDFFIGGGAYQWGQLYLQRPDGHFTSTNLGTGEKIGEDAAAIFLDADQDGDPDLLLCSGSSEYGSSQTLNAPRLYVNDGSGQFALQQDAIPENISTLSQTVVAGDYDGDGDADIFLGGRELPDQYPVSPRSYILRNDKGRFTDVTTEVCPALEKPGMITGATWTDFNGDGSTDLVICGDWMPIRFFANHKGVLQEVTGSAGFENLNGLWRSIRAADLDMDGDMDLLVGNLGLNNKFHPSKERPLKLFANDFDKNGSIDMIPAYYIKNNSGAYELFPGIDRTQFSEEMLFIKKKYLLNEDYAKAGLQEILDLLDQKGMISLSCETTASVWLENDGKGKFTRHELPGEAQYAPINCFTVLDLNRDNYPDVLLGGNEYQADVTAGRYDASYGLALLGRKKNGFQLVKPGQSGFVVEGQVKQIQTLEGKNHLPGILVSVNNDSLRYFRLQHP